MPKEDFVLPLFCCRPKDGESLGRVGKYSKEIFLTARQFGALKASARRDFHRASGNVQVKKVKLGQ